MNQRHAANRHRRFPFTPDANLGVLQDRVVVDFMALLSVRFGGPRVRLISHANSAGAVQLVFEIVSTELPGYQLVADLPVSAGEDVRVVLTLEDSGGAPHPELGYGVVFLGIPAAVPAGTFSGLAADIEPTLIRLTANGQGMTLRVANLNRPGPSTCAETQGAASVITLLDRVAEEVADCVETTLTPNTQQRGVRPTRDGTSTEDSVIPPPAGVHTRYANGAITTITTHAVTIDDEVPATPATYDADVAGAPVAVEPVLKAGHNVRLTGSLVDNAVSFHYRLGAGLGADCVEVKGYPALSRLARDCVKAVNGVHSRALTLESGAGIGLVPDPGGHRILILVNAEDAGRALP